MMTANKVLLRRGKVLIRGRSEAPNPTFAATFNQNLSSIGYVLDPSAIQALSSADPVEASLLYKEVVSILSELRGVRSFRPMYPNFPKQVMIATDAELYVNALMHYFSVWVEDVTGKDVIWLPKYKKDVREPLADKVALSVLHLGTEDDLSQIATQIAQSNTSISPSDKEDLKWLIENGHFSMPQNIPNKENASLIASIILSHALGTRTSEELVIPTLSDICSTATDVLRVAVAMSEGDISLASPTKFKSFSRPERRVLLALLENCGKSRQEDMQRFGERWIRLGEKLHPREMAKKYPLSAAAFTAMRSGQKVQSFNAKIEQAVRGGRLTKSVELLSERPGEYARRLDHLLRQSGPKSDLVLEGFEAVASSVSTPVLLQVASHFKNRATGSDLRVVFPKGNTAKVKALENKLPEINVATCEWAYDICNAALKERFAQLPSLGKVFVDPELASYTVPFSQRSASRSMRRLERGSQVRLANKDSNTLRFFIWWKQQEGTRTDLDLSAIMYGPDWQYKEHVSYFQLRAGQKGAYSACHSGDITEAPEGACEFIDIDMQAMEQQGARFIAMCVNSYTRDKFNTLAECKAGWMLRGSVQSGEVFDPRTVQDSLDVASESTIVMPLVVDVVERKIIWADMAIKSNSGYVNNIAGNYDSITLIGKALTEVSKPNLYDLFKLHGLSRGTLVNSARDADVVFSVDEGIQFEINKIASEFMGNVIEGKSREKLSALSL